MYFAVLLRALVLFVIATPIFTLSPRVTTPDSFEYVFKDETLKIIKVEDVPVRELKDITTGIYSLKLAAERVGCASKVGSEEYLGFNNRTCTSSLAPSKTAGPVMRGPSSSMMWREWLIRVQNKDEDRVDVTLQAFMHPALGDQGKCLGYLSNYYGNPKFKGSCVIPPHGNGLFLNGTEDTGNDALINPQVLSITTAPPGSAAAEGAFELKAANKPDVCMRALAAEDCGLQAVLVEDPAKYFVESKQYKTWILTKRYDVVPKTSAPPPLSPPPTPLTSPPPPASPPPPVPIPGPRIEPYQYGQTVVTWGYIELSVKSFGGNTACSVESIVFTAVNKATAVSTSTAAYAVTNLQRIPVATVPLPAWTEYEVYAVGACSSGESTARSNVLSVLSESTPIPPHTFNGPTGIAISGSTAFVTNSESNDVSSCTVSGSTLVGCSNAGGTGFNGPFGIALLGSTAFVTNSGGNSVSSCTVSGSKLTECSTTGGPFNGPTGIAILSGPPGSIAAVTNTAGNSVSSCTVSGSTLTGCVDSGYSGFSGPYGVAIDGTTVFVTNIGLGTVSACTGACSDSGGTGFNGPIGIAISGSTAFVTNLYGNSVSACTVAGSTLVGCSDSGGTGFNAPVGIAISGSTAFVTNYGSNSVSGCTVAGSTLTGCSTA